MQNSFRTCGIYPYNPYVIDKKKLMPANPSKELSFSNITSVNSSANIPTSTVENTNNATYKNFPVLTNSSPVAPTDLQPILILLQPHQSLRIH